MKDPNRINVFLSLFKAVWENSPDLRFLQLVKNIYHKKDFFYIEDEIVIEKLKDILRETYNKNNS